MGNNFPIETAFTLFDMFAIGTVIVSIAVSAMRGWQAELIAFIGWLISLTVATASCNALAVRAFPHLKPFEIGIALSFVLIFVCMRLVWHLINYALNHYIKIGDLTYANRAWAGVVGLFKGFLFVSLAVLMCSFTSLPQKESWQIAKTSRFFEKTAKLFAPALPNFLEMQVWFPPRYGDPDYVPPEAQNPPSGSLKNKKTNKINQQQQYPQQQYQQQQTSQPPLNNLPQGTSTE